jgi:sugar (pentulose or hexulose) kinase
MTIKEMVTTLAIDVGSSSVKAAVLTGTRPVSPLVRHAFPTRYDGVRAEVDPAAILRAVRLAAHDAVTSSVGKPPDVVALSSMSPSWLALDKTGKPLTPVITHQDRRSLEDARRIEAAFGKDEHLAITGNRPVPGGISSTTAAHFARHHKPLLRKAALVGHLQTFLLNHLTGARAADPSNASFMGLYKTTELPQTDPHSGWHDGLVRLAGLRVSQLPNVLPGDTVAGLLTPAGSRLLSLPRGTPVLTGVVDTSAAVILAGALPGMLVNASGSTDVLAVVTEVPEPDERYLTRALGVSQKWLSVATLPAAGSAIVWARQTLFPDLSDKDFFKLVAKLSPQRDGKARSRKTASVGGAKGAKAAVGVGWGGGVTFFNGLAGSRTSVDQPTARFDGLRLSTTRDDMLAALIHSLATASADRLALLRHASSHRIRREVLRTGGTSQLLSKILYRFWPIPRKHLFTDIPEATVLGLGQLAQGHPV